MKRWWKRFLEWWRWRRRLRAAVHQEYDLFCYGPAEEWLRAMATTDGIRAERPRKQQKLSVRYYNDTVRPLYPHRATELRKYK